MCEEAAGYVNRDGLPVGFEDGIPEQMARLQSMKAGPLTNGDPRMTSRSKFQKVQQNEIKDRAKKIERNETKLDSS